MRLLTIKFLKENYLVFVLIFVALFICYKNYTPNTWLSGWDTLHHEFNFGLNLKRDVIGVWRSYQGLGAVAGHSHTSDIPRQLLLMLFSLVLPLGFLRYLYVFLTFIAGPVGMYFFLHKGVFNNRFSFSSKVASFLGGLFYMLNLGTLQQFYVPFEMFTTAFAFLPIVYLFSMRFLQHPTRKQYIYFLISLLCVLPMAYAGTLAYMTFGILLIFLFSLAIQNINKKSYLFRWIILLSSIFLINSYWILPNLYFVFTRGREVSEAKINYIFSEEAFLNNKKYGTIADVPILRNFLFGWNYMGKNGDIQNLMNMWRIHLDSSNIVLIGYAFFIFVVLGFTFGFKNKDKVIIALLPVFLLSLFIVFNTNPPLGFLFELLRDKLGFFKEALRFPFTKISITLVFTYSVSIGYFSDVLFSRIKRKGVRLFILLILCVSIFLFMFPAFKGYLISPSMRISIPEYYFEMFKWFDSKETTARVATFPISSYAGWVYYDWGYQGSGFLQFGIKQPLLDRDFDRWNLSNEQFYRELYYAVYNKDTNLIKDVLNKYNVRYLILDESVIDPNQTKETLFKDELKEMFSNSTFLHLVKKLGSEFGDNIFIFEVDASKVTNSSSYLAVNTYFKRTTIDTLYTSVGNYLVLNSNSDIGFEKIRETVDPTIFNLKYSSSVLKDYVIHEKYLPFKVYVRRDSKKILVSLKPYFAKPTSIVDSVDVLQFDQINASEYFLGFGELNKPLKIPNITNQDIYIGDIVLDVRNVNSISLYEYDSKLMNPINLRNKVNSYVCYSGEGNVSFEVDYLNNNSFTLKGNNGFICGSINIKDVINDLPQKRLVYMQTDSTDDYCLAFKNACVNSTIPAAEVSSVDVYSFMSFSNSLERSYISVYKDIKLGTFVPKQSFNVNPIAVFLDYAKSLDTLNLDISKMAIFNGPSELEQLPKDCSLSIKYNKATSLLNQFEGYKRYTTIDGTGCFAIPYNMVPKDSAYLLRITSRNVNGLPMRVCVKDLVTNRCVIYTTLSSNKNFTEEWFLIPYGTNDVGYAIDFSNYSIGSYPAINDIKNIELIPFPYRFLKNEFDSSLMQDAVSERALYLDQSYDPGWLALCGYRMCDAKHVKVNNWANGWIFDDPNTDVSNVKIVFWPQILEYIGFFMVVGTFAFVIFHRKYKE